MAQTVFAAQENSDQTEGRGSMRTVALFTQKKDAEACAKGRRVMGVGNGKVEPVTLFDNFDEFSKNENTRLKDQALQKLTLEERNALGI